MAYKQIHYRSAARERVLQGATALVDAMRVTLGPKSKSVLIERKWGAPLVCNDGVTIAKELELKDPEENLGARMMREAAERTGSVVGDGTTTATLLAYAIFSEGVRNVAAGSSAIDLKRGLDRGLKLAIAELRKLARPVRSRMEKAQVATVSAHNDPAIGELVAEAIERVGGEGVVSVEESKGAETQLEVVEGMQFDRGYLSPYFVTEPARMECVLESPLILLHDGRISALKDLVPLLEKVVQLGRPLLILAEEVEAEPLATLVVNKLRGTLACAAVKAPGFGDRRKAILEDLAVLTGGRVISSELGTRLEHATAADLGKARRVVVAQEATTIVGGQGDKRALEERIAQLRKQAAEAKSDYDKEKLEERLGKLSGGVAVVRVGAPAESELQSRKEAFDDAIHATKAAVAEGIVPGGGLALLRMAAALEQAEAALEGDERIGVHILRHALEVPTRQIAENSGVDAGVVVERMRSGQGAFGFDAARGTYLDLLEAGIIDPAKVVRLALENAVSVASVLLLTEATLTEVEEPRPAQPAGPALE